MKGRQRARTVADNAILVSVLQFQMKPVVFDGYYWNVAEPHIVLGSGRRVPQYVSEFIETDFDDSLLRTHNLTCLVVSTNITHVVVYIQH